MEYLDVANKHMKVRVVTADLASLCSVVWGDVVVQNLITSAVDVELDYVFGTNVRDSQECLLVGFKCKARELLSIRLGSFDSHFDLPILDVNVASLFEVFKLATNTTFAIGQLIGNLHVPCDRLLVKCERVGLTSIL
jgi:hypothetical protein